MTTEEIANHRKRPWSENLCKANERNYPVCLKCNGWGRFFSNYVGLCDHCNGTGFQNPEDALLIEERV